MAFFGSSSRSGSLQEHDVSRITGAKPDQVRAGRLGPCSVAAHAPANDDEKIPVLVPQAPGEEIAFSFLTTTAPLGHALCDAVSEAPAPASTILILILIPVSPLADPLAKGTPQILPVVDK